MVIPSSLPSLPLTPAAISAPRAVAMAAALLTLGASWAQAQPAGLPLRSSPLLEEKVSARQQSEGAVFVKGEQITARPDMDLVIEGQASIRRPGLAVSADRVDYDQTQDVVDASGKVRVSRETSVFTGPHLNLKVDSFQGTFEKPDFELYSSGGYGQAAEVEFVDDKRSILRKASYTTCRRTPGPEWLPEWLLKATQLTVDEEESTIDAKGVQFRFKDVPIFAAPSLSLPLTNERKSGLLPPLFSVDTVNGVEVAQPYYFDIAPNRDATVTTHVMSQRGIAADTEFRYLERDYSGQVRLNLMPADKLRDANRWGLSSQHNGGIDTGLESVGRIGLGLTLNRVSDNNYWRDFPRSGLALTQRILPSTGVLSWGKGDFSMTAQVQRWQNLQDAAPPYDRAPQITMRYGQWNAEGLDWSVVGDTTRFEADYSRVASLVANGTLPRNGERSYIQAQVSRPWIRPWGFVTPKVQLHATRYQMDRALDNGALSANRVLPTFSVDSGLVFERETRWFGRDVLQTLEPRAFYARTPYKNQDMLPVYDSGATDFNLATIFSENAYVGQDRLVDNDALTLGLSSRFFDAGTGAEMLRIGMAQRIRFSDQQVNLSSNQADRAAGLSDILFGAGIRWDDRWSFDATIQAKNQTHEISRTTLQGRYSHSAYRVINMAYRANNQVTPKTEFVDVGWQWPLSDLIGRTDRQAETAWTRTSGQGLGPDRWYSVGRLNYSLKERSLVDTLVGLEYDAGCWLGRVAFERLQTNISTASPTSATSRILFQLEFVGFARVGISPLKHLSDNIPRYQYLRDSAVQPSRFQHYE
ncbi:LPS-assembly protein LptD [Limnohabitans sp. T6-20]|uniref:LPS-assembly protein LptD n=1 Tax=Limnohabitans sp. T6-20 TaxID=1100725 RepID=UPI001E5A7BAE|nr:LPS assembly protein LptD [Limnohabitans sp. T6-20]